MPRYVALLGSINVGGNRVKMADLRAAMAEAGFGNPATVAASGNVIFDDPRGPDTELEAAVAAVLGERFAIRTFAVVHTRAELIAAIEENPFGRDGDPKLVHTGFAPGPITAAAAAALDAANPGRERIAAGPRALYVDFVDGIADSKLTAALTRKHLGCSITARNLRSLRRIADAMAA
jgi:uncharacterized protein (DUF1697 family)